jgi:hypothetical protein
MRSFFSDFEIPNITLSDIEYRGQDWAPIVNMNSISI